jgi:hypothetical protein
VKIRILPYLLPLCVWLLTACDSTASRSPPDAIAFDTAKRLDDFDFASPGDGRAGEWSVIENDAGRALAQINAEPGENRLSFCHLPALLGTRRLRVDTVHDHARQGRSIRWRIRAVQIG